MDDPHQDAEIVAPDFRQAQFLTSASKVSQCPPDEGWEVAFAGRSNAGKSSAINSLVNNKKLARTSRTPGRTQLINFFQLTDRQRLVDLPGYGYAKVPMAVKREWNKQLENYLQQRGSLKGMVLLMDSRRPMQPFDEQMLNWAVKADMPVHILLTKSDKLKKGPAKSTLLKLRSQLAVHSNTVTAQLFSALKHTGHEELSKVLNHWLTNTGDQKVEVTSAGEKYRGADEKKPGCQEGG